MKEIKFRALDSGTNEWLYFTLRELIVGNASHNLRLKNWCQYTDLKDKRNREIYEGDIVKFLDDMAYVVGKEKIMLVGEIKFIDGAFWCFYEEEESSTRLVSAMTNYWCDEFKDKNMCEIIGNIYENRELLNEKD